MRVSFNHEVPVACVTFETLRFHQSYGMTHSVTLPKGCIVLLLQISEYPSLWRHKEMLVTFLTPEGIIEQRNWSLNDNQELQGVKVINEKRSNLHASIND